MSDLLGLFFDIFWGFFDLLDNMYVIGSLSVLKLLIITFLFVIAFKFLFPHSKGGS